MVAGPALGGATKQKQAAPAPLLPPLRIVCAGRLNVLANVMRKPMEQVCVVWGNFNLCASFLCLCISDVCGSVRVSVGAGVCIQGSF